MSNVKKIKVFVFVISLMSLLIALASANVFAYEDRIFAYSIDANGNETVIMQSDLSFYNESSLTNSYIPDGISIATSLQSNNMNNLDAIIGDDTRDPLEDYEYSLFPYCTLCKINIKFDETEWGHGTGFLVGPSTILTSAHVVYDCDLNHNYGWFDDISIAFGEHINSNNIIEYNYGTLTSYSTITCGNFRVTQDEGDDWAIIDLYSIPGSTLGYLGLSSYVNENLEVGVAGYSYDFLNKISYGEGSISLYSTYKFNHNCDLMEGASGAPVMILNTNTFFACGIQSTQTYYGTPYNGAYNTACRINGTIISMVNERIEEND